MKKHQGEVTNDKMKSLEQNLMSWRIRYKSALKLLKNVQTEYAWYFARNKYPPTSEIINDDGYKIVKEPDNTIIKVKRIENGLLLEASALKDPHSYSEVLQEPESIPRSWHEFDQLRRNLDDYFKSLAAETALARKELVIEMIHLFAKPLAIKVEKDGRINPKYLKKKNRKGNIYIVNFKYDYAKKMMMGVSKDDEEIPAINLTRK